MKERKESDLNSFVRSQKANLISEIVSYNLSVFIHYAEVLYLVMSIEYNVH